MHEKTLIERIDDLEKKATFFMLCLNQCSPEEHVRRKEIFDYVFNGKAPKGLGTLLDTWMEEIV